MERQPLDAGKEGGRDCSAWRHLTECTSLSHPTSTSHLPSLPIPRASPSFQGDIHGLLHCPSSWCWIKDVEQGKEQQDAAKGGF